MKKFLFSNIILVFLFAFSVGEAQAQHYFANTEISTRFTEIEILVQKLGVELETLPPNIKRVAFFDLRYDKSAIDKESYNLLKGRIESTLVNTAAIKLIGVPETLVKPQLIVTGTDSSLVVSNTFRKNNDESTWFVELAEKYNLDAFIEANVRYEESFGYVLSLRVIRAATRDVIWSGTILSREVLKKNQLTIGRAYLVTAGINHFSANTYMTHTNNDSLLTKGVTFTNYAIKLMYRQPADDQFRGTFGVLGGIHQIIANNAESDTNFVALKKTFFEFGIGGTYSYFRKKSEINDYWLDVFGQLSIFMPVPEDNLVGLTMGANVNVSYNIGLAFHLNYLMSSPKIIEKNLFINTQIDPLGYGFSATFRF